MNKNEAGEQYFWLQHNFFQVTKYTNILTLLFIFRNEYINEAKLIRKWRDGLIVKLRTVFLLPLHPNTQDEG